MAWNVSSNTIYDISTSLLNVICLVLKLLGALWSINQYSIGYVGHMPGGSAEPISY